MSNIYVDVNLNSTTNISAGPRPLTRDIIRSLPILDRASDYSVIVSRLVLNPALLPIWIPVLKNIQPIQESPNTTVYSVGLTCRIYDQYSGDVLQTIQASAPVMYQPTRAITPPHVTPLGNGYAKVEQPKSAYCHIYDIGQIIEMFNKALMIAYIPLFQQLNQTQWASEHTTLMQQLEAPYFSYDFTQQNLKINAKPFVCFQDITGAGAVSLPYMEITISFSAECYPLLQGFYCRYNNLNTLNSTPYDIDLIPISNTNLQKGLYLTQSGTASLGPQYLQGPPFNFDGTSKDPIYNSSENVPTIAVWQQSYANAAWTNLSAVQSIQLITDMATRQELTDDANQSQQTSNLQTSILCDFFPDNLSGGAMSSVIVYNSPTIDNGRIIKLESPAPLVQFSISAYFTDSWGNRFPLLTTDQTRPNTIKLCFIKK